VYVVATGFSSLRVIGVDGPWIPDRAAAAFLRENSPGARVLTWFDWGEYALWQLSPVGIRVSMDGRRETVYSARVLSDHQHFYQGRADMVDYPERIGADLVWLPSTRCHRGNRRPANRPRRRPARRPRHLSLALTAVSVPLPRWSQPRR
jgi:hypothetical protein